MLIVVRSINARSGCSLGFKPILSKRADCRSLADGGVHAGGGVAAEKDEIQLRENATVALLRRPGIPTVTAGCAGFEQHRQRRAAVQELPFA